MPSGTSLEQYRRDERAMLELWERLKAAEATGRAAVRALALVAADYRAMALIDAFEAYRIMELLATDMAQAWLAESDGEVVG